MSVLWLILGFVLGVLLCAGLGLLAWGRRATRERAEQQLIERARSDHERATRELEAERDRLGAVLEGMNEGVIAFDRHGRVTLVNPAMCKLLGQRDIPRGTPLAAFGDVAGLRSTVVEALKGKATARELTVVGPPSRLAFVRATPATATGGCVAVVLDVTELRRVERSQRDFVSNTSHELRTPVAVVLANAETLASGALEDAAIRPALVDAIVRHAQRLADILDDLLNLARIEGGRFALHPEPLPLAEVIASILAPLEAGARARGQTFEVSVDPAIEVYADERVIDHALTNFAENAIKYGASDRPIRVRARPDFGAVRIEVIDDGPGLAPEHRARVFERFYRVDEGRSRTAGGTGLGLAIASQLVDLSGGEIGVDPNVPTGCVFWFTLRRATAAG